MAGVSKQRSGSIVIFFFKKRKKRKRKEFDIKKCVKDIKYDGIK